MTAREVLDGIRANSEGLTDLCPEHLRQSIRHVQRNCDIDCNTHEDDYDACEQPDRYDGERMAKSLADVARLVAAVEAVLAVADDLEKRGDSLVERGNNGSIYATRAEGRALGYLEGRRLIRAAVEAALKEGE